jgi:SAM-dependent methyltransferase
LGTTTDIETDDLTAAAENALGSPNRFGFSWDRFNDLSAEQERQFQCWTAPLNPETDWRGKRFLDVGCGAGRNSYWPMTYGAAGGMAIDMDDRSLAAAQRNLRAFPSVKVDKQSAYDLNMYNEFDLTFSIGVIHHLAAPEKALRNMMVATKPGGKVLVWVYGYENMEFYVNVLDPLRKVLFSKMPLGFLRTCAHIPSAALWLLLRLGFTPIEYFRLLKTFPYVHLHHIIFDQMLPQIANYWTGDEVRCLMQDAGLEDIQLTWVNQMSWSAIGTKP